VHGPAACKADREEVLAGGGKMKHFMLSEPGYEMISYTLMIGTAAFTSWQPGYVRRKAGEVTHLESSEKS